MSQRTALVACDAIASEATLLPEGCPEPWRSAIVEWVALANAALRPDERSGVDRDALRTALATATVALHRYSQASGNWLNEREYRGVPGLHASEGADQALFSMAELLSEDFAALADEARAAFRGSGNSA